jgi:hypothetical protein
MEIRERKSFALTKWQRNDLQKNMLQAKEHRSQFFLIDSKQLVHSSTIHSILFHVTEFF